MSKKINMKTIAFALPKERTLDLVHEIDMVLSQDIDFGRVTKHEDGSPKSNEGHCITYKIGKQDIFFAMIHSNQETYLVRADPNLVQEV
jgi:hypothetical protein